MSELIDPLKFRSFGVKRPLDEKQQKINDLLESNKRYYPTDTKGNVDEWGAVIKRQTQAYEQQRQALEQQRVNQMQNYGQMLEKELHNQGEKKKMAIYEKNGEKEQLMRDVEEKRLREEMQREQEKQRRQQVGDAQKQAIELKQRKIQEEKRMQMQLDQENVQNQLLHQERMSQQEAEKRRMMRESLSQNLDQSRRLRVMNEDNQRVIKDMQDVTQGLSSLNIQDNYKTQLQDRMRQFDDIQRRAAQNYNQNVANRQSEKESSELIRQMKDQQLLDQRANHQEQQSSINRQQAKNYNSQQLQMQLQQRNALHGLSEKEYQAQEIQRKAQEAKRLEEEEIQKRKQQQMDYRDMLDQQNKLKQKMKLHGNMTGVEKQMNKDDLIAWKNYDNNQYSLIPGISLNKKKLEREPKGGLGQSTSAVTINQAERFQERQDMMKQYGYTRDPREAYATIGKEQSAGISTQSLLEENMLPQLQQKQSNFAAFNQMSNQLKDENAYIDRAIEQPKSRMSNVNKSVDWTATRPNLNSGFNMREYDAQNQNQLSIDAQIRNTLQQKDYKFQDEFKQTSSIPNLKQAYKYQNNIFPQQDLIEQNIMQKQKQSQNNPVLQSQAAGVRHSVSGNGIFGNQVSNRYQRDRSLITAGNSILQ
eukprot:403351572